MRYKQWFVGKHRRLVKILLSPLKTMWSLIAKRNLNIFNQHLLLFLHTSMYQIPVLLTVICTTTIRSNSISCIPVTCSVISTTTSTTHLYTSTVYLQNGTVGSTSITSSWTNTTVCCTMNRIETQVNNPSIYIIYNMKISMNSYCTLW